MRGRQVVDRGGAGRARAHVEPAAEALHVAGRVMNEPEVTVPVTSVKTTRVNIASVTPVRKRPASG